MIVLNSDFVLKQVLESIYPYAHKIVISEGAVKYWQDKGVTMSIDDTVKILYQFPDPDNKIKIIHGQYEEKTEQCRAFMEFVPDDTDYLWCIDADEVFKGEDIEKVIEILEKEKPNDVGFQSNTFFGGFSHVMTGFERNHNFKRILKYEPGCEYKTHRPPTLSKNSQALKGRSIKGFELFNNHGIAMYHYSYVSAKQVRDKIQYYESSVIKKGDCIPNYFEDVWRQWVLLRLSGSKTAMKDLEEIYKGVHEFKPEVRGYAYTQEFKGKHPEPIENAMEKLGNEFLNQFNEVC